MVRERLLSYRFSGGLTLVELLERDRATNEETAYLSKSTAMKWYVLESCAQTEKTISFEETLEKRGV